MIVKYRLTGVAEIDRVLKGLPLQLNDRILQQAHAAAAKPLVEREKLTAPEGPTGNLVDSIGIVKARRSTLGRRELGAIHVGPRRGGGSRGYHAHLPEYGTRRRTNRRGANRGIMPKKPFAAPAWNATSARVQGRINEQIGRKLYAFMKRTIKR
jgi:hypothetical protein